MVHDAGHQGGDATGHVSGDFHVGDHGGFDGGGGASLNFDPRATNPGVHNLCPSIVQNNLRKLRACGIIVGKALRAMAAESARGRDDRGTLRDWLARACGERRPVFAADGLRISW